MVIMLLASFYNAICFWLFDLYILLLSCARPIIVQYDTIRYDRRD